MKILAMLKDDHDRIMRTIGSILATTSLDKRRLLFTDLVDELQRHMAFEEEVFYPQAAVALPMDELEELHADRLEHGNAWELLAELQEDLEEGADDWEDRLKQLSGNLETHMFDEENNLYPMLQQDMDPATLKDMAMDYEHWRALHSAAE